MVVDSSSPVIVEVDEKPISGRSYRPCWNCFLSNVQCPNEMNLWLTLPEIISYAHLDYGTWFFKDKYNTLL